ncbi:unnamed protein product, partial [Prorocentrum cordatum]
MAPQEPAWTMGQLLVLFGTSGVELARPRSACWALGQVKPPWVGAAGPKSLAGAAAEPDVVADKDGRAVDRRPDGTGSAAGVDEGSAPRGAEPESESIRRAIAQLEKRQQGPLVGPSWETRPELEERLAKQRCLLDGPREGEQLAKRPARPKAAALRSAGVALGKAESRVRSKETALQHAESDLAETTRALHQELEGQRAALVEAERHQAAAARETLSAGNPRELVDGLPRQIELLKQGLGANPTEAVEALSQQAAAIRGRGPPRSPARVAWADSCPAEGSDVATPTKMTATWSFFRLQRAACAQTRLLGDLPAAFRRAPSSPSQTAAKASAQGTQRAPGLGRRASACSHGNKRTPNGPTLIDTRGKPGLCHIRREKTENRGSPRAAALLGLGAVRMPVLAQGERVVAVVLLEAAPPEPEPTAARPEELLQEAEQALRRRAEELRRDVALLQRARCEAACAEVAAELRRTAEEDLRPHLRLRARQGRLITARAISWAAWQNNIAIAELLIATMTLGKEQLLIQDTTVVLQDPQTFANLSRRLHQGKANKRQAMARAQATRSS